MNLTLCVAFSSLHAFLLHKLGRSQHRPATKAHAVDNTEPSEDGITPDYYGQVPHGTQAKLAKDMLWSGDEPYASLTTNLTQQAKVCKRGNLRKMACYQRVAEGHFWLAAVPAGPAVNCQAKICSATAAWDVSLQWKASNTSMPLALIQAFFAPDAFHSPTTNIHAPRSSVSFPGPAAATLHFKPLVYCIQVRPSPGSAVESVFIPLPNRRGELVGAFFLGK